MFTPKDKNIKTAALTHSHLFTKLKAHLALSHAKLHLLLQTPSLYFAKSTFSEGYYDELDEKYGGLIHLGPYTSNAEGSTFAELEQDFHRVVDAMKEIKK